MYESLPAPSGLMQDPSQPESSFPPLLRAGTDAHMLHRDTCPGHLLFFFWFHCCYVPLGLYLFALPVLNFSLIFFWPALTFSLKFAIVVTSSWMSSSWPQARAGDPLVSTTAASVRLHGSTSALVCSFVLILLGTPQLCKLLKGGLYLNCHGIPGMWHIGDVKKYVSY